MRNNHKKIMVAHSFFLKNDRKQREEKLKPYPPLATLHAASLLIKQGYDISFFDALLSSGLNEFQDTFDAENPDILILYEDDFNFLTKMCLLHVRDAALTMVRHAKQTSTTVIVHSADATDAPESYLSKGADFVIAGEGEETLVELIAWINRPSSIETPCPAGIIYYENDQFVSTQKRPAMRNLDNLPQPAWDLIDFGSYRSVWEKHHNHFSINMVTTRGCPYKCNWCSKPIWGQQYVSHSPDYIVDQLEILMMEAQPDHIWFADDIFGLTKGWIGEFANLIKSRKIKISYTTQTRADLVNETFARALKTSGCQQIWIGVESGSQHILDSMDKGVTLEQIKSARIALRKNLIDVGFFIQLGYPGEDVAELNATRNLIIDLQPEEIGVSVSYPLPGTKFYDRVKSELKAKTHWQESSDLDPTFISTFSAEFYQKIRDHLHRELKHLNAGREDSFLEHKWHDLMAEAGSYRNSENLLLEMPAE